ncbi:hypothetical protein, partial [uncultured Bilophila sp.]|uniref:hypothetical protein n=1 Tax=uncultured Bilophila sp. TaxID=529385 RepID=UPI00280ABB78
TRHCPRHSGDFAPHSVHTYVSLILLPMKKPFEEEGMEEGERPPSGEVFPLHKPPLLPKTFVYGPNRLHTGTGHPKPFLCIRKNAIPIPADDAYTKCRIFPVRKKGPPDKTKTGNAANGDSITSKIFGGEGGRFGGGRGDLLQKVPSSPSNILLNSENAP